MRGKVRPSSRARLLADRELRGERRARTVELLLLSVALLSTCVFLLLFTSHYLFTGYATLLNSYAGEITEVEITRKFPTSFWNGVYGLALRVPGFTEQLSVGLDNEIKRSDVFFDCLHPDPQGGINELYASNTTSFDFNTVVAGNITRLESYMGCAGRTDCANNTFTQNMSILLGTTNISGIPSTFTFQYEGNNDIFQIGFVEDASNNFAFVALINNSVQKGYTENVTVNYQMLLPTPENTSLTYYFLTDPFEECPEGGGIGSITTAHVWGWVNDSAGNPLENVTINLNGFTNLTNASGFYNMTVDVTPGNYSVVAQKSGYDDAFGSANITFNITTAEVNFTMNLFTPGSNDTFSTNIFGYIYDSLGIPLDQAEVSVGGETNLTTNLGYYSLNPALTPGNHTVLATKVNYNNNYTILNLTSLNTSVQVDMRLSEVVDEEDTNPFASGPYTEQLISNIREEAKEQGEDFWVSTKEVVAEVRQNTFTEEVIGIYNFGSTMNLQFALSPELTDIVSLDQTSLTIPKESFGEVTLTIYGTEPLGVYEGNITMSGSLSQQIPVKVTIVERRLPVEALLMKADLFSESVRKGEGLKYKLTLQNLLGDQGYLIKLTSRVRDINGSEIYVTKRIEEEIDSTLTLLESIDIPEDMQNGEYYLDVEAQYLNLVTRLRVPFRVTQPLYLYAFLGIPLWIYLVFISFLSFVLLNLFLYKRHLDKKKRYRVQLDYKTLPGSGERNVKMGHIAETKKDAWYEIDKLTVHTVVAGATGMGKSISAQVLIEECLMKNVAVIVFDPTAQWSGMLRKCTDKKMLSFYPKFGLKPTDARGFPGNIRAIKDARQQVDLFKYVEPGHIQIFTLNKLQPKDMDIFVANVIRQIFESDPKEHPQLKTLLVFDEVHRLLPRFGGSGEGFLQIERGAREFRKWGLGLILISQVMNDFVGEIKANINTEIQARTVEERDLERIKSRYGEEYLKSLVKSEVGVSMFQNAEYNRGRPYFINFRPILHNTRRLSDEELEKYNQYNDKVEDLEYQVEQLEELKVDIFDLKMEIKLIKGKIMTGNFAVVDIYLEGLEPRVAKQWEKLGKKPKKKELKLVSLEDIKASVAKAKAEKDKAVAQEKAQAAKDAASAVKKEDVKKKILSALTFDNGAMISSVQELEDLLPTLDDDVFKTHVNPEKNDIAEWIKQLAPNFAASIKGITDKAALIEKIKTFKEDTPITAGAKKPKAAPKPVTTPTKPTTTAAKPVVTDKKSSDPQKLSSPSKVGEKKVSSPTKTVSPPTPKPPAAKPVSDKNPPTKLVAKQAVVDKKPAEAVVGDGKQVVTDNKSPSQLKVSPPAEPESVKSESSVTDKKSVDPAVTDNKAVTDGKSKEVVDGS